MVHSNLFIFICFRFRTLVKKDHCFAVRSDKPDEQVLKFVKQFAGFPIRK